MSLEMKNSLDVGEVKYSNVSCDEFLDLVDWRNAKVLSSLLFLAVINVIVIVGNLLVIMAVLSTTKLRTVTNLFIVSLAVADLMVGIAVLPFSATWEILEIWIFGEVWCSMWLAVDVWMCTASILNLCAISLDRYVAVTRPVTYPSIMSSKKAKLLIGAVWVLSFLICFPPLVGWNDRKRTFFRQLITNTTNTSSIIEGSNFEMIAEDSESGQKYQVEECAHTCELTNDKGYVVYSAMGSFFLPMFVMLFFYWRIYRAAVETTRAINQGFRTTKGSRLLGTRFEEQRLTLRIHRGRSVQNHHHHHRPPSPNPISPNGRLHSSSARVPRSRSHERIKVHLTPPPRVGKRSSSYKPRNTFSANSSPTRRPVLSTSPGGSLSSNCSPTLGGRIVDQLNLPVTDIGHSSRRPVPGNESENSTPSLSPTLCAVKYETLSPGVCGSGSSGGVGGSCSTTEDSKPKLISKMGKRNIKAQVKRFRMETKAAKTLGIIVGGFILCWLPFFTMYVIRAFCATCIPPLLFSILFWLGYCNSALNPCIYALFSKDFRFAFKKIICSCICQREKKPQLQVVPIFLSSLGDDSEGNNELGGGGSDSRRNSVHTAMLV